MANPGCDKATLLTVFADNTTQNISPADMRQLINCVYDNFLDIANIIDNTDTYVADQALSANQGALLSDKLEDNEIRISDLEANKADLTSVYTKIQTNDLFYQKSFIDANFYTKNETYDITEIDNRLSALYQMIQDLDARIDNIVSKNNLIE